MKKRKLLSLLLSGAMVAGLLAGCGNGTQNADSSPSAEETGSTSGDAFELTVNIASEPQTIDPALNSAVDGAIMISHMFEGLMRWNDSGAETTGSDGTCNNAELGYGQAESYDKDTNADGTVTYTFHLRDGIKWSDGKDVTAQDFVFSWQRLVTPETAADYNYMIDCVVNANEIMAGEKDPSELAVSAPDDKTFVVTITSDLPYFTEICAFPATFPVRQDIVSNDQWTYSPDTYISNGAYKMTSRVTNSEIVMEPNEYYYNVDSLGPQKITFKLMDDANAMLSGFNSGELDFIETMPTDEVAGLLASGDLKIVDYIGTYYVCFQTQKAPFDNPLVREAFTLAVDRTYIVQQITQTGQVEAGGFVPAGVYDAEGATGDDFRTVGGDYYKPTDADYEANCERARELLAEAGYPDGKDFPVVTYLYNTDDSHKAVAEALQNMWQTVLGVTVQLDNQEWATFLQTRKDGDYSIARNGWIADYNDPMSFLDMWLTGGGNNDAQYANPEYDNLIQQAKAATDPAERMSLMHQAEDLIIGQDYALCPLYFYTQKYMLADGIQGMYYTPLGYFFFDHCTQG
ncbi:peptide ABC transporter substrate-binding protein [Intestinimonas massiliensis (ex Afouda et al. 2020)]|uniref:peptide ABC transporter substrate-binding protein n=1 Tax=Intestinimonas massiliensis (ex Afouda et al. 2020) TaxID=1673721 RepID=UPI001031715D|nr:peptide ABC transporter substrate-binding protein [Intestinimonas massiliensis (ex Afouda et al. 2020)]